MLSSYLCLQLHYSLSFLYCTILYLSLIIDNIITTREIEYEDEGEGKIAYVNLSFQIENIGRAVEKDYKLLIKFNFTNYSFKYDPLRNDKNFNHSVIEGNRRMISFFGVSPIFPDEVLTIGNVKFGLLCSELDETLKAAEFQMKLLYTNGDDEMTIKLSEIFKTGTQQKL